MLNIETLREIYYSIRQNKVRTVLSGFGISWGILILVVLLGTGKGFQASVMDMFSVFAQKSIYVYGGSTSTKHRNLREGAEVRFDRQFLDRLKSRYPEIEAISPEASASLLIQQGIKSGMFRTIGVMSDYLRIKILNVKAEGRLFNPSDISQERNVAVIGENVETMLFGNRSAVGKMINIAGAMFRVTGVLNNNDIFSASEINSVYIPFTSYIRTVNSDFHFNAFCLYLAQNADSKKFEEDLRNYIANQSGFSVKDKQALYIANFETQTSSFETLFGGLRKIIWIFGICFLISGMVGIANIMFVIVKDRTNEVGIRLAVGAMPRSIVQLILLEAVVITALSGFFGLLIGKGLLMLINWILSMSSESMFMKQTSFDLGSTLVALVVLVIVGVIAGSFPAIKASSIEPVDAIRYENRG